MANPQKILANTESVKDYGNGVYKVEFSSVKKIPRFKAGQFLHLTLDDFDPTTGFWPESRVFSIASCSEDRKRFAIVYSVKGGYTKRMERELVAGRSVWLKAPYGDFIIEKHLGEEQSAVLIAGGTGVSPFIPFLTSAQTGCSVQLFYGLRDNSLMIFKDELEKASEEDSFDLHLYLENAEGAIGAGESKKIQQGLLSIESILRDVADRDRSVFFISGPPVMIDTFKQQLNDQGIDKIVIDEWG